MNRTFSAGFITSVTDAYNMGILVFLVLLGMMVSLMNKAGGSAAFGRWAQEHIHSRVGAQLATILLGVMIFIDDYFNCLTVGSVMRPLTDKHKISRAKLAYLIDATAAPVCIIAPISSWAAAVAAFADDGVGLKLFVSAIPFNFYALLTVVMMVAMVAIFYFMLIRPQRKKDKQVKEMLAALKPGDRITTIGGIYGTIKAIKDDTITLYVGSDRMEMVVARWAIRGVEDVSIKNDGEELT